ncbi:phosphotransferase [Paenibacillus sp. MMS20-IR301]|uniref:phosphotransferase enzyme family protein n=1 Tax=Paenibacillus sp. MMS20-IR301 TaxID=2895946 RepID=UPI0028EFE0A6|nr:phosphotransferase [Paenibacillus sp. MMS20-IR301]WNS41564.1 phosphotransferase [Paenibacillus sp. MMS20-IR301]
MNDYYLRIAKEALSNYSITCKSIDFIAQSGNTIYKVTDHDNNSYSLRLHISKGGALESYWSKPEVIRSEMVWLHALALDTDLTLPSPYKNTCGEFVTVVDSTSCTLLQWVEGEQKPFIPTAEEAGLLGELIGKLHRQASKWQAPDSFERPAFDGSRILESLEKLKARTTAGLLDAADTELLQTAGRRIIAMMNSIERTPGNWGMIHADLIPNNLVFHGAEVRPIDFGACGFGYYLFDLGSAFSFIHPAFREQLLKSYSMVHPLPDNYVELLEGFFIAAQLDTMNFWMGLPDSQEWLPGHIRKLAGREVAAYVNNEPYLYSGVPHWE